MRPGTWDRLGAIFFRALELPKDERAAYVARACGDDEGLRGEVEAVLAAHLRTGAWPDGKASISSARWSPNSSGR